MEYISKCGIGIERNSNKKTLRIDVGIKVVEGVSYSNFPVMEMPEKCKKCGVYKGIAIQDFYNPEADDIFKAQITYCVANAVD